MRCSVATCSAASPARGRSASLSSSGRSSAQRLGRRPVPVEHAGTPPRSHARARAPSGPAGSRQPRARLLAVAAAPGRRRRALPRAARRSLGRDVGGVLQPAPAERHRLGRSSPASPSARPPRSAIATRWAGEAASSTASCEQLGRRAGRARRARARARGGRRRRSAASRRRLGQRAAQVRRGALGRAARAGARRPRRAGAPRSQASARRLGVQQVQRRSRSGSARSRREQLGGVRRAKARARRRRSSRTARRRPADARAPARGSPCEQARPRVARRRRGPRHGVEAGERARHGAAERRARARRPRGRAPRRRRAGGRAGARRCARPARARTSLSRAATSSVGCDAVGASWRSSAPSRNGLPAGDGVAGVREAGSRRGQPLAHERLRRGGAERARAHGRLGCGGQQLGQQVGLRRRLARAHGADHAEPQLVRAGGELRQPAQRRRVGPVHVVDDEHGRAALGEVGGQPDQPVRGGVHRVAGERRLGRLGCSARPASPAAPTVSSLHSASRCSGAKAGARRPRPRPARAGPRARAAPSRRAPRALRARRREQARLADSGRVPRPRSPGPCPARTASSRSAERGQFGVAVEQRSRMRRPYAGRAARRQPAGERSWWLPRCARARRRHDRVATRADTRGAW